jgi:hypothetical protein
MEAFTLHPAAGQYGGDGLPTGGDNREKGLMLCVGFVDYPLATCEPQPSVRAGLARENQNTRSP